MVLNPKPPLASCYSVNQLNYWRKYKFVIICQASANKMDYIIEEYKRSFGKVFTSVDGNKYIQSKHTEKYIFLKCAIFRTGCKGTCRINRETNLVTPLREHNHTVNEYMTEVFKLKSKCKSSAKSSQTNLRKVFDDATRTDPHSCDISFPECESSMYRARRKIQTKIPLTADEFSEMLSTTPYGEYFKIHVTCCEETGVIFFSEQMVALLSEVTNIQFDGTFYTVPNQFSQLWTVFVSVERHTLPAIHCLITAKSKDFYKAVLENIAIHIPQFLPSASMSDWEPAARNALREDYPQVKIYGCWFHYT